MKPADKKILEQWEAYRKSLIEQAEVNAFESIGDKRVRIEKLKSNWEEFAKYYFPNYCNKPFAKFHKKFAKKIIKENRISASEAWSRDHAKSVIAGVIIPAYLLFTDRLKNMLLVSYNYSNAEQLLMPLQIQLESNPRIINDFGLQRGLGSWEAGRFITTAGCSFRAIGSGQNPRGSRNQEARPDFILVDDIDDDETCRNPKRLDEAWQWMMGALFGCLSITGNKRFIVVGNIIAKDSLVVRFSKKADNHETINILVKGKPDPAEVKLYAKKLKAATEDDKIKLFKECHSYAQAGWVPSWPERFSLEDCVYMIMMMGYRLSQREYFNNPISEGKVFKKEWFQYGKVPPLSAFKNLAVTYLDPGFKKTKSSDTKALVLVGLFQAKFYIIKCFVGQASISEMISWCYAMDDYVKLKNGIAQTYMEVVFLQDLLYDDFNREAVIRKRPIAIISDQRKKPDKDARIEANSGYYERGEVILNEEEKDNHHMHELVEQYLAFEPGVKTKKDGPDAVEGAIHLLNEKIRLSLDFTIGKRHINSKRA